MPALSSRSPEVRALTTSLSAQSPCSTTLFAPSSTQPAPFALGRGQHVGHVVARLTLAMRERELHAALGDRRQDRRLLRRAAGQPSAVPPSTTVARYGSSISARPNASITSMISTAPPPNPPYSSANGRPSRPSSAYCDQSAVLQPSGCCR